MPKRGNKIRISLYFFLIGLLLLFLFLHAFNVVELQTGFFTRFLISLLVVVLLLPLVPKIKIFDIVDVRRDTRFLRINSNKTNKKK
jgi:hypothetical protein